MAGISRRSFLQGGVGLAAGAALAGPFQGYAALASTEPEGPELVAVPDERDGVVRLSLPAGFKYRSFQDNSAVPAPTLSDGSVLPGRHDGMAAFAARARTVKLVRNHEINGPGAAFSATAPTYDPAARGGTTTTQVDLHGNVGESVASLVGTQMNCCGGPMPWRAWVTCEETVNGPDVFDDFTRGSTAPPTTYVQNALLTKPHGFIFEVPVDRAASATPITAAGRFAHEAVALDPLRGHLYLTEDDFGFPSGFYRYEPPIHPLLSGRIRDGGRLWMLAVRDRPNLDLSASYPVGTEFRVRWVRIDDPSPTFPMAGGLPTVINDAAIHAVASQGWAKGAGYFSRLEGAVYDRAKVYFCSTQGGADGESSDVSTARATGYGKGFGQIWAYDTFTDKLRLVYQSPGPKVLDFPDNITASQRGTLVVCEDHTDFNFVRGLTRNGRLFNIAENLLANRTDEEFAGATFSPDGSTLFVNIQATQGQSIAIWGDWDSIGV